MPDVIIIGGAPGVGKSTLVAPLKAHFGGPHANIGRLRDFHLKPGWPDRNPHEESMAFDGLVFILRNYARYGYANVITDDLRDYRIVQMPAVLAGLSFRIITLTLADEDELRRRIEGRTKGFRFVDEAVEWNRRVIGRRPVQHETKIETVGKTPQAVFDEAMAALSQV